jgi:hypothetical protein
VNDVYGNCGLPRKEIDGAQSVDYLIEHEIEGQSMPAAEPRNIESKVL